jgi:hypothetical protein
MRSGTKACAWGIATRAWRGGLVVLRVGLIFFSGLPLKQDIPVGIWLHMGGVGCTILCSGHFLEFLWNFHDLDILIFSLSLPDLCIMHSPVIISHMHLWRLNNVCRVRSRQSGLLPLSLRHIEQQWVYRRHHSRKLDKGSWKCGMGRERAH